MSVTSVDAPAARPGLPELRERLRAATLRPEGDASEEILAELGPSEQALRGAQARAARWVEVARADTRSRPLVEQMLEQFPLDSAQGKGSTFRLIIPRAQAKVPQTATRHDSVPAPEAKQA